MVIQLAQMVLKKFPGHMLVFVGDEVVTKSELAEENVQNKVVFMGEFWKPERSGEDYAPSLRDRNSQRYLFELLAAENKAVSIGMRSGSLEGMALLGLPVIFIDDKGNNAAERMEFWAGSAADERSDALWFKQNDPEEMARWEKSKEGPMANYKRLATHLMMGDEIDKRTTLLNRGKRLFESILNANDHGGSPICDEEGKGDGAKITESATKLEYKLTVIDKKMPADPQLVKDFLKDYETVVNFVDSTNYMGQAEAVKSSFYFNLGDIETIEKALKLMENNESIGTALQNLGTIKITQNVGKQNITGGGETSQPAADLIGALLEAAPTNSISQEQITEFNRNYGFRSRGFAGKKVKAAAAKVKFIKAHIAGLIDAADFLLSKNLLQPDELKQLEFLVKYLSGEYE